jgi:hypothetical protein
LDAVLLARRFYHSKHVDQEMTMKKKSESASNSKGNGSAKHLREAGRFDSPSGSSDCLREQIIAEAAYFYAERRGFAPGNEMSDWLQAEADVEGHMGSGQ